MIGKSLAHFRITAKLGEGGMGEVYRAEDTKLGREVAVKVLPDAFAQDPDRMGRFAREAQVLASLNHPNIAGIYQVEQVDNVHFLVMELVEGETLAERIQRGRLDAREALELALQIAVALEEAHENGIIHRDLKPANVKITPKGEIKVLDFGLAKAMQDAPPGPDSPTMLAHSPTLTGMNTSAGVLLGTAAYMAPEQARGENVDRRADIWAFGVTLMEMVTGKSVYTGKTVADTLAGVLAREPEWEELPARTPRTVRRLLERCLDKDVRNRLQAIGEARLAVERFLADPDAEETAETVTSVAPPRRQALPWVVAAALGVALVGTLALWFAGRGAVQTGAAPRRASIALPEEQRLFRGFGAGAVLSPDGTRMAYVLGGGNDRAIYLQSLDQWQGTQIHSGTSGERPYQVFFSPDGDWLGFVTPKEMKKMPIAGGTPITLCAVSFNRGASWGRDGTIVFAPNPASSLYRIPDAGGEREALTTLDKEASEVSHRWPQILPGGQAVLFTSHTSGSGFYDATLELLMLESGERRVVHRGGTYGRYLESGHLVYIVEGTLFGVPFDVSRLEVTGSAAPLVEGIGSNSGEGSAQYDVSRDGTLAYVTGSGGSREMAAVWLDRDGTFTPLWEERQSYRSPRLSPDGGRLAVSIEREEQWDVWVYDIERDVPTRLSFDEADEFSPVWSPDGRSLFFNSGRDGVPNIYRKSADGSGAAERITQSDQVQYPYSITGDGKTLAFGERDPDTNWDLWTMPLDGDGEAELFLATEYVEIAPAFSPDGRWIAYSSNESGLMEVYVRPRAGRGKWQVSTGGGVWPMWSVDGSRLFFRWDNAIHVVTISTDDDALRAGRAEVLVEADIVDLGAYSAVDLGRDGRFIVFEGDDDATLEGHEHVQVVFNWFDELNRTFKSK